MQILTGSFKMVYKWFRNPWCESFEMTNHKTNARFEPWLEWLTTIFVASDFSCTRLTMTANASCIASEWISTIFTAVAHRKISSTKCSLLASRISRKSGLSLSTISVSSASESEWRQDSPGSSKLFWPLEQKSPEFKILVTRSYIVWIDQTELASWH